jgi:membrane protein DedA with SNARE-associated domain
MNEWVEAQLAQLSYWKVTWLMLVENLFPPIPSEVIMPSAGYAVTRGGLTFPGVVLAGAAGSLLGALVLYWVGGRLGRDRIEAWADRRGAWLALTGDDVRKAFGWFDRHGGKAVFVGRLVPGVRSLISLPAGAAGMSLPVFLLHSGLGSGLWAAALAWAGMRLGERHHAVERWLGPAGWVVLAVVALAFAAAVVRRRRLRRRA